jgi:colanic acid biosynthesis glycosyl transferase WcaI
MSEQRPTGEATLPVAVVIPVKNEEACIAACLERLQGFAQVFVVDSGSTDRTCEIARAFGAAVVQFEWNGRYPKKRNWFLLNHPIEAPWVLFLDADELVDDAFKTAVRRAVSSNTHNGYWISYRNAFLGKRLRFGVPQRKLALFRTGCGLYERIEEESWSTLDMEVHEHPVIEGSIGEIRAEIDHREPQDLGRFLSKHIDYARWEARRCLLLSRNGATSPLSWRQKAKYRLLGGPFFPLAYFLYAYVVRLGFLDGWAGLSYAFYKGWYFHSVGLLIAQEKARMTSPRVFIVNRYFAPDHSATGQLASDLAFHLAGAGFEVHAIAGARAYDGRSMFPRAQTLQGVRVRRVRASPFGRARLFARALDDVWLHLALAWRAFRLMRRGDVAIALTDPPLAPVPLALAARLRGARAVNWLQDLYPETAQRLGLPLLRGAFGRPLMGLLAGLRNVALRAAAANVAIGENMARALPAHARARVIPNWADDEAIRPLPAQGHALRAAWGLEGRFALGYSGNLGRAHEWETLLAAAEILRAREDIVFLFIGGGFHVEALRRAAAERGLLERFRFQPYQPREALGLSLTAADAHWISLRPQLEGCVLPSKAYGVAAAGRPILFVGAADGDVARMLREAESGLQIDVGDGAGLARAIARLADDPDLRRRMGDNARKNLEAKFGRSRALTDFEALIRDLAEKYD